MNIALITAGGSGPRMHQDIPKQFLCVENKPIIVCSLGAFQQHPNIDEICVAILGELIFFGHMPNNSTLQN